MDKQSTIDRIKTLLGVTALFVALVGGFLILQKNLTQKVVELRDIPEAVSSSVSIGEVDTQENGNVEYRYYENSGSNELLIYFHGASGPDNTRPVEASKFINVLAPSYISKTIAPIPINDQALYDAVDNAMAMSLDKGFNYQDIKVVGFSMGGAQAIYAATRYPDLKIVIPVATFTSFKSACVNLAGASTCSIVPNNYLLTEDFAGEAKAPIHQYHSRDDKVVNFSDGKRLFGFIGSRDKEFTELSGEHNSFNLLAILNENL